MKQLYNIVEGILDDQDEVMDKMTDDLMIKEIKDFLCSRFWEFPCPARTSAYGKVEYTFGSDAQGYYFDTSGHMNYSFGRLDFKSVAKDIEVGVAKFNKFDKKNCPMFRWRKHEGTIAVGENCQNFESLDGMPEEIDFLYLGDMVGCQKRVIDCSGHKIKKMKLYNVGKIILKGDSKTKVDEIIYCGYNGKQPNTKGFLPKDVKKG